MEWDRFSFMAHYTSSDLFPNTSPRDILRNKNIIIIIIKIQYIDRFEAGKTLYK